MDINNPANSRILAVLIQQVSFDKRFDFLEAARAASDIESFIEDEYPRFMAGKD